MHILHTETSEGWGGQEIRTFMNAERIRRRGHQVTIMAKAASPLLARARAAGFRTAELRSYYWRWDPRAMRSVARQLDDWGVDIIHTHSSRDSWAAGVAAKLTGRVLVRTCHSSFPMGRRFARPVYRLPDAVITASKAMRDTLVRLGIDPARVHALPSGVDLERFRPRSDGQDLRAALGLEGHPVITMVARLAEEKQPQVLLEAAALLRRNWPASLFALAGGGPPEFADALRRQAAQLGIAAALRLLGLRDDVPEIIAASDVCVLPTNFFEGVPQAVVQYLAMAKPVVATAVGGIPEVIEQGRTGLLVRLGDAQELADSIDRLLRHPQEARQMGEAGRRLVCERFDAERVAERTLQIYEQLLRRKGAA